MPRILLTGAAGLIGVHLSRRLLAHGEEVVGVDNLNFADDVSDLNRDGGFKPSIQIESGLACFANWFCESYRTGYHSYSHAAD